MLARVLVEWPSRTNRARSCHREATDGQTRGCSDCGPDRPASPQRFLNQFNQSTAANPISPKAATRSRGTWPRSPCRARVAPASSLIRSKLPFRSNNPCVNPAGMSENSLRLASVGPILDHPGITSRLFLGESRIANSGPRWRPFHKLRNLRRQAIPLQTLEIGSIFGLSSGRRPRSSSDFTL